MPEPSDLEIPPPKDWQLFERWACDLFSAEWETNAKIHGRTGQPQHGVDIYAQPKGSSEWYGVQCKKKDELAGSNLTVDELRKEVEKAKEFTPPLTRFIIATTGPRDASVQQYARQFSVENQAKGLFSIDIMFWDDFLEMYDRHPSIFRQHFRTLQWQRSIKKNSALSQVIEIEDPIPPEGTSELVTYLCEFLKEGGAEEVEAVDFHRAPKCVTQSKEYLTYLTPVTCFIHLKDDCYVRLLVSVLQRDLQSQEFDDIYRLYWYDMDILTVRYIAACEVNTKARKFWHVSVTFVTGRFSRRLYQPLKRNRYSTVQDGKILFHYFPKSRINELRSTLKSLPLHLEPMLLCQTDNSMTSLRQQVREVINYLKGDHFPEGAYLILHGVNSSL